MTPHHPSSSEDDSMRERVEALVREAAEASQHAGSGTMAGRRRRHVEELALTSLKLLDDGLDAGQMKLLELSMKEMRRAYRMFNRYRGVRKVSIFGSARTP